MGDEEYLDTASSGTNFSARSAANPSARSYIRRGLHHFHSAPTKILNGYFSSEGTNPRQFLRSRLTPTTPQIHPEHEARISLRRAWCTLPALIALLLISTTVTTTTCHHPSIFLVIKALRGDPRGHGQPLEPVPEILWNHLPGSGGLGFEALDGVR